MPMTSPDPVARREVELINASGLHLRAANQFVGVAQQFRAEIRVSWDSREADGKSILDLMTLAAERGCRLALEARGEDAAAALAALVDLVSGWSDEAEG
jgi:phosphocarrier protein